MRQTKLRIGQKVVLKANKEEGWPREEGRYIGRSGNALMVEVFPRYRDSGDDDGLREVTLSQIER